MKLTPAADARWCLYHLRIVNPQIAQTSPASKRISGTFGQILYHCPLRSFRQVSYG
ncbi:MAG: hypothetical protein KatS3mg067_1354 [Thermosynechococcus sp.]|nr:MAG: hypothetical protein KatS3mg067_1354 [Thermosynechococcus sp.]